MTQEPSPAHRAAGAKAHPLLGSTNLAEVVTFLHLALSRGTHLPLMAGFPVKAVRLNNGSQPGDACIEVDLLRPQGTLRTYTFDKVEGWSEDTINLIDTFEGHEGPSRISFVPRQDPLLLADVLHELMPDS